MRKINVLITHVSYQASAGSFIKMLRNSVKYKCYIVGCDSLEKGFSSGSMLVDKFYHISSSESSPYIDTIKKIIADENINLVISAEEEDLILFKKNKIEQALYPHIADYSIFELFKDKHLATQTLKQKGFTVPRTIMNLSDFNSSSKELYIRRKRVSCGSRGITIYGRDEIKKDYLFFDDDYITQEFLKGKMYTVDVFCDKNGKLCSIIPREILASKDGTTFKCIVTKEETLINICKEIYSLYCIPGISNIQFIVDEKPHFIELNPRAAATMIASSIASFNYMEMYISHFLYNENLPTYEELMSSVKWNSVVSRYYQETICHLENN